MTALGLFIIRICMAKKKDSFYVVTYRDADKGETITLKAESIEDSSLGLGFVKISGFMFDTNSLVVKPIEEHLRKRFENIKSIHLNVYSIMSIEEVGMEHKGLSFNTDKSNLVMLPKDYTTPLN